MFTVMKTMQMFHCDSYNFGHIIKLIWKFLIWEWNLYHCMLNQIRHSYNSAHSHHIIYSVFGPIPSF